MEEGQITVDGVPVGAGSGSSFYTNSIFITVDGDDATGARNDASKPFYTLLAANAATHPGDAIYVGPGTFNWTNRCILSNGVSLIGSGPKTTTIKNYQGGSHACIVPNTNTYIYGLHITNALFGTTNQISIGSVDFMNNPSEVDLCVTNCVIENCELWGDLYPFTLYQGCDWYITLKNCFIYGASGMLLTGSSMHLDLQGTTIIGYGESTFSPGFGGIGVLVDNISTLDLNGASYVSGLTNSLVLDGNSTITLLNAALAGGAPLFNDPGVSEIIGEYVTPETGDVVLSSSITTGVPTGGALAEIKWGALETGLTLTLNLTNAIRAEINGVKKYIMIANQTPP